MEHCIYLRDYIIYRSVRLSSKIPSLNVEEIKHELRKIWYSDEIDSKIKFCADKDKMLQESEIEALCTIVPENIVEGLIKIGMFNNLYYQKNYTMSDNMLEYNRTVIFTPCDQVRYKQIYKNLW